MSLLPSPSLPSKDFADALRQELHRSTVPPYMGGWRDWVRDLTRAATDIDVPDEADHETWDTWAEEFYRLNA